MNIVILSGKLGKDAEHKQYNDLTVSKFSLAVPGFAKGEKTTMWVNVDAFKCPQFVQDRLIKGASVTVQGSLNINKHDDKFYTSVSCNNVELHDFKKKDDGESVTNSGTPDTADNTDDPLPF